MTTAYQIPAEALSAAPDLLQNWLGEWAILPEYGQALFDRVHHIDLAAHVLAVQSRVSAGDKPQQVSATMTDGGVMVIDIVGTLQKQASSLGGTSTTILRRTIGQAAADEAVKGIMLRIDSPGGQSAGTLELANAIEKAAAAKPTWAYIEDTGASAAYWAASQASRIVVNETGKVGSIGTYMSVVDYSAAAAREGVKVHVIRAGSFKGAGVEGTEITPSQLAEWQRVVESINSVFVAGVAKGRKQSMDTVTTWADGRVHVGKQAVAIGLADGVSSFEAALADLTRTVSNPRGRLKMSENTTAPKPATAAELRSACPRASDSFLLGQLEKAATLDQACAAYRADLEKQLDDQNAKAKELAKSQAEAEAKAKAAEDAKSKAEEAVKNATKLGNSGVKTHGDGAPEQSSTQDPIAAWNEAVEAKVKSGKQKSSAICELAKESPELHASYIKAYNADNRAKVPSASTPRV